MPPLVVGKARDAGSLRPMRTSLQFILTTACTALLLGSLATPLRADIMYVSNFSSDTILKFTSNGVGSVFFTGSDLNRPIGLAFDSAGNLYAANAFSATTNDKQRGIRQLLTSSKSNI